MNPSPVDLYVLITYGGKHKMADSYLIFKILEEKISEGDQKKKSLVDEIKYERSHKITSLLY